ncbi:MAG: 50S ribosomal protein L3 [Candidatus Daviesbacteria bacterium GW2011_GWA1_36_8]|uniref:Large ribosomal subunit protein uL3 n=4 Tax=Candidatus Daviesiibacteriota TaxID=1752718 RepID=A0A0G0FCV3_9BACT|nr:MAG: 50S ribosomal protein L3 [Candidatus Daviesbacteria bacterium GW2011_GWA1_36_8]
MLSKNMLNTLLGIKKGMTSTYDSRGRRVGATLVQIEPNFVTQVKVAEGKDGYNSVQLGISTKKSLKKPQLGHLKKAGIEKATRWMREIRTEEAQQDITPGQEIQIGQVFFVGDALKVTGTSKGKGFQGGVRRHGFHGGPKTHGQSDRHRAPGSIGTGTTPGRVLKGKKMAGHMGSEKTSYRNLEVVSVDKTNNILAIKGGVPGPIGGLVIIEKLGRIKGYTPPPEEKEEEEVVSDVEQMEAGGGTVEEESKGSEGTEESEVKEKQIVEDTKKEGEENAS